MVKEGVGRCDIDDDGDLTVDYRRPFDDVPSEEPFKDASKADIEPIEDVRPT